MRHLVQPSWMATLLTSSLSLSRCTQWDEESSVCGVSGATVCIPQDAAFLTQGENMCVCVWVVQEIQLISQLHMTTHTQSGHNVHTNSFLHTHTHAKSTWI